MHKLTRVVVGLTLFGVGGCAHSGNNTAFEASWTQRDRQLLADPPYSRFQIPEQYKRRLVHYGGREVPGTIVVDSDRRHLYLVLPQGRAIRYGVTVGEEALAWSGSARIGRMQEWPAWVPTPEIKRRLDNIPDYVGPGAGNPMGARALYLYEGNKDTLYRIHGTNQPEYIGHAISSGCIRMTNEDAIDLYNRVKVGTSVIVLGPGRMNGASSRGAENGSARPKPGAYPRELRLSRTD